METRTCHRCGTIVGKRETCPVCTDELLDPQPVETMTAEERLAEFDSWGGIRETSFGLMHQRLEQLVGRPIFTHEFAYGWESLRSEIMTGKYPETVEDTLKDMPEDIKDKFIVFDMRDPSETGFSEN